MKKFYVYEWFNLETGEIFYVGKGCGKRYLDKINRNKNFLEYIEKNKTSSRIVKEFDDEDEAFKYEKTLTDYYKEKGMCKCNLIDGGYGGYSKVWTNEMKEYWSKNNPMKAEKQRERMKNYNPMKNPEIAKKVNDKKKRPVIINGVRYDGTVDAARDLKVWENTILNWCKRGYNTNGEPCRYEDEEQKSFVFKKSSSKAVIIDNIEYPSLKAAANALGVKDSSPLCKALKANRPYKGHICKYANQQPS